VRRPLQEGAGCRTPQRSEGRQPRRRSLHPRNSDSDNNPFGGAGSISCAGSRMNMGSLMALGQIGQFHENPAVIAWWRARAARALEWLTPARRRTILALGAVWIGFKEPLESMSRSHSPLQLPGGVGSFLVVALLFALLWLCFQAASNFKALPGFVRRHPLISLHLVYWGLLLFLLNTTPELGEWRSILIGVAVMGPLLIWRCSYLLQSGQYGRVASTRFRDHLMYLWPAYGGSDTPYGKGLDYLSRNEAKSADELARSQLAGFKLLLLSLLWSITKYLMDGLVYGEDNAVTAALGGSTLGVPRLNDIADQPGSAPLWASWASIYCELVRQVLKHAANGHAIIAILRIFGFNVFRNTYKPLLAESLVSFWGRYYYYFKELLVNFFFLPTFAQLGTKLRNWPNLRLLAAVFASAFVGNVYYHSLDPYHLLVNWHMPWSRVFYCFLLAVGIFVSMWREKRRAGEAPAAGTGRRVLRIAGVWTFFAIIFIWNTQAKEAFSTRTTFFLSLFGLA
jgi:hypothetical protein